VVELVECCAVMGCMVLAYSFRYTVLVYYVFMHGCFSFTSFCHFSDSSVIVLPLDPNPLMTSFMLRRSSSTSSPNPLLTSSQLIGPVPLTVFHNLERTVSEARAREMVIPAEQPIVESMHPMEVMTMVGHPAEDIAGAPTMLDMALVLASTSSPTQCLAEDVVL
jgi:hypothetical protein